MPLSQLPRLARTLWYTKPIQLFGKLRWALGRGARRVRLSDPAPRLRVPEPAVPWLPATPHTAWDGRHLRLIGTEVPFGRAFDWSGGSAGRLFAFHLHQFDWARGKGASPELLLAALNDWVANVERGDGWHPAPTSLRTFAWIKLLTTPGLLPEEADTERVRAALAEGVATIAARPETHLLANHYLWNLLALVFAGVCLDHAKADEWLGWQTRLAVELDEQFLPDGGHYERCPTYHGLLLENVLDLLNAARVVPGRLDPGFQARLAEQAGRMVAAHSVWQHPDGEIALFGDSAFGIAHAPDDVFAYAEALGVSPDGPGLEGALPDTAIFRLAAGPYVLIATADRPTPEYQPGHSHCDALSFELSIDGERVVTDTGVCEYEPGTRRDIARATRSHATIEVEGREQAEFWQSHRFGGRPDVGIVQADPPGFLEAVCAGYATPEVLHRRRFEVDAQVVRIHDEMDAPARSARIHLPLAPGLEPVLDGTKARVPLHDGAGLEIELPEEASWRVERRPYYPEFGREELRAVLVGDASPLSSATMQLRVV